MNESNRRAVLFSGQGAQKIGMGLDLVEQSPTARALYETADRRLGWSVSEVSFRGPEETLTETRVCQPALYVHGLAILGAYRDLTGRALRFEAAAGLSLGEYTAHTAAGTFNFEAGLHLVDMRGQLMQAACETTQGTMGILLGATLEQAQEIAALCDVDIANVNCPGQIVLSGETAKMEGIAAAAKERGIRRVVSLKVAGAYHSRLMAAAATGLAPFLTAAHLEAPVVPVIANYTADITDGADQILRALENQVCGTVRWEDSIRRLIALGFSEFVECGPGGVIGGMIKRIDPEVRCLSLETHAQVAEHAATLA
jgi:[acyl-carrier-protein] S-malonyltransferase